MTAFQVEGRTHVKVEKGTTEKRPVKTAEAQRSRLREDEKGSDKD